MDRHNQWRSHLEPAHDELTYQFLFQQEERAGTQQHFTESIPGYQQQLQQNYTSPPTMALAPNNPFLLSHSCSRIPGFLSFWGSASSSFEEAPTRDDPVAGPGQPSSSLLSFGGGQASTFMLSGGSGCPEQEQDSVVDAVQQAPERRPSWNAQTHVIAERRRRQKMQQQFVALATIVPDLTKADKISVLGSTIEYVKKLEEKVKALEQQSARTRTTSSASTSTLFGGSNSNPAVQATVHADTVLLKICCKEKRGVLVVVLSEIENRGLSILDTSVLPFKDSFLNITITTKVEEGFSNTGDLVNSLTMAIRGFT